MPQEKTGFSPAPTITLVPAFPPGRELGVGLPRGGLLAAALAALSTWQRDHGSCIAVSQHLRWLDLPVYSQVIG
ncbi:hypothetical protein N7537_000760 [Penicillium hordei]|uniref:Uncharacterized protein n=1 Tax=Penicillium hordei TaxID=40994 RepID=A0AAD6H5D1_9EURO|nr:uncharacterized protein N7537_000760 [Penicillium hordei]KAJ5615646.1 hypothetical protein N7537_000760 [Penicillium hordei]